jgi:hypothetical protein
MHVLLLSRGEREYVELQVTRGMIGYVPFRDVEGEPCSILVAAQVIKVADEHMPWDRACR